MNQKTSQTFIEYVKMFHKRFTRHPAYAPSQCVIVFAGGVVWTYFASPSVPQEVVGRQVFYRPPVTTFGGNYIYPQTDYGTWAPVNMPPPSDTTASNRIARTKRETSQHTDSSTRQRMKRFFPYMYGMMPGMMGGMMGGYGTGMASASAAAAAGSSGSFGYPFMG
jgi:hypothetical protein